MGLPILGGLFSMFSDIFSNEQQHYNNLATMYRQSELNEAQAQRDFRRQNQFFQTQMSAQQAAIDDERKYNDPAAVAARYKNAGINPTAAFGTAGSYTPTQQAGHVPSGSTPGGSGVGLATSPFHLDPIQGILALAQADKLKADAEKTRSETPDHEEFLRGQELTNNLTEQRVIGQKTANDLNSLDLEFERKVFDTKVKISSAEYENLKKRNEKLQSDLWNDVAHRNLTNAQIEEVEERIWYNQQMVSIAWFKANSEYELTQAQIEKIRAEIPNLEATLKLLKDEHARNEKELRMIAIELGFSEAEYDRVIEETTFWLSNLPGSEGEKKPVTRYHYRNWERLKRDYGELAGPASRLGAALILRRPH